MRALVLLAVLVLANPLRAGDDTNPSPPLMVRCDLPVESDTITVGVRGTVRNTSGQPLPDAAVELVMNPYHPGPTSTSTWSATDSGGRYELRGQGHHGTARVRVAAEGYRQSFREVGFLRRDRELEFNFSLGPLRADGR